MDATQIEQSINNILKAINKLTEITAGRERDNAAAILDLAHACNELENVRVSVLCSRQS